MSISDKAGKGLFWSAAERFSVQVLQFILSLILARLLLPTDYGLIGMITIFIAISQTVVDSGFTMALIQKKDRNEIDYSTTFFFNIGVGIVLYFVLFLIAPFISSFYGIPSLSLLIKIISISIIITSFAGVHRAKLTINLDFKTQAKATLLALIFAGSTAILMAYKGYGVWALVAQTLLWNTLNTLFLWVFSKWIPKGIFSFSSFKSLFNFGSKVLGAELLDTIFKNIYLVIIGKLFSARELGFYTRAQQFQQFSSQNVMVIIQRVTFPLLSSIQDDKEKLLRAYREFLKLTVFLMFPIIVGLAVVAKPLISLLLTDKWLPSVPILQLLCFAVILYPVYTINLNILNVIGRSDLFLKLEVINKILIALVILLTFSFGITALLLGQIFISVIVFFINSHYSKQMINYGIQKQIRDILPTFFITIIMAISVWGAMHSVKADSIKLLLGMTTGITVYLLSAKIGKFEEIRKIKNFLIKNNK